MECCSSPAADAKLAGASRKLFQYNKNVAIAIQCIGANVAASVDELE
jgi:hypothetical protein